MAPSCLHHDMCMQRDIHYYRRFFMDCLLQVMFVINTTPSFASDCTSSLRVYLVHLYILCTSFPSCWNSLSLLVLILLLPQEWMCRLPILDRTGTKSLTERETEENVRERSCGRDGRWTSLSTKKLIKKLWALCVLGTPLRRNGSLGLWALWTFLPTDTHRHSSKLQTLSRQNHWLRYLVTINCL